MALKGFEEKISQKCAPISEKKSILRVLNPECIDFFKIKVDTWLYTTTMHKKCDYLLLTEINKETKKCTSHFVELKGNKVKDAFEQITETISRIWWKYNIEKIDFVFLKTKIVIVSSKSPLNYQTELKQLIKKYPFIKATDIFVKRTPFSYPIN